MRIPYYKCNICGKVIHTSQCEKHIKKHHSESYDFDTFRVNAFFKVDHYEIWTRYTGTYREEA